MRHFSSSTYDLKTNTIIVKYVTNFQWFFGYGDFLSRRMCSPVWMYCYKRPNYDFCISQGSVETVMRWGGLNYSINVQFLPDVAKCQKLFLKIDQCFTELFKDNIGTFFIETRCSVSSYSERPAWQRWSSTCCRDWPNRPEADSETMHITNAHNCFRLVNSRRTATLKNKARQQSSLQAMASWPGKGAGQRREAIAMRHYFASVWRLVTLMFDRLK